MPPSGCGEAQKKTLCIWPDHITGDIGIIVVGDFPAEVHSEQHCIDCVRGNPKLCVAAMAAISGSIDLIWTPAYMFLHWGIFFAVICCTDA